MRLIGPTGRRIIIHGASNDRGNNERRTYCGNCTYSTRRNRTKTMRNRDRDRINARRINGRKLLSIA